jgi:hypothetical protein
MIIPCDVLRECAAVPELAGASDLVRRRVIHAADGADRECLDRIFEFAVSPAGLRMSSIARWRAFMTTMFCKHYESWDYLRQMDVQNTNPGHESFVSTSPFSILPVVGYLYHLDSWGVAGDVIECGCFKGMSAAYLSWACKMLGRRLYAADSFQGLPATMTRDEGYYKPGDYAGSLDEVKRTVARFGCADVVEFVPGFFESTLAFLDARRLALIWADVDLASSMNAVLRALVPRLDREGVLLSDEVPAAAFDGHRIKADATSVPGAIRAFAESRKLEHAGANMNLGVSYIYFNHAGSPLLEYRKLTRLLLHSSH